MLVNKVVVWESKLTCTIILSLLLVPSELQWMSVPFMQIHFCKVSIRHAVYSICPEICSHKSQNLGFVL